MKTSSIVCILVVLTLLGVSTSTVRAVSDSDSAISDARADSGTTYDWEKASSGFTIENPVPGTYNWSCSLNVYARAGIRRDTAGSSWAEASANASVTGLTTGSISAYAYISGVRDTVTDSDSWNDSGTDTMRDCDLTLNCSSEAKASYDGIGAGLYAIVYADGDAWISASIEVAD